MRIQQQSRGLCRRGISLLETLLASALLGGVIMTACGLSAGSLRAVRLNQEYEKAWDYIERQLTLIELVGVQAIQQAGQTGGQFESLDGRIWHWDVQIIETGITSLYEVVIRLQWDQGGRRRQVACRTRMTARTATLDATQAATEISETQTPPEPGGRR